MTAEEIVNGYQDKPPIIYFQNIIRATSVYGSYPRAYYISDRHKGWEKYNDDWMRKRIDGPYYDLISIPRADLFDSLDEYYATLFHEFGHSARHPNRLHGFSDDEGFEQAIANRVSHVLCDIARLQCFCFNWYAPHHAVIQAAQEAVDYILGKHANLAGVRVLTRIREKDV